MISGALLLIGACAVLAGVWFWSPPAALIVGGLFALVAGVGLLDVASRERR